MSIQVYNSLTRTREPFEPLNPPEVKMYVCGPTVYESAHIGHAMSYLIFDMIRRYLEHRGYHVRHVQNFTDVEDKIINRSRETGEAWDDITSRYIEEFLSDMDALNIQRAHFYPYASREIPEIIRMIEGLIEKGYAYASEGDVYFRVLQDEDYGKLANRKLEEQQAGARVSDVERERKEHPLDFALWKAAKPGEPYWESPWGEGRPGWHIECSAMSLHYLGEQIDIHGGGADLLFPHHENEIAQSESFTGCVPFAKYWIHNGLLQVSGEKMSKSLQNFFTIRQFLERHSADALRLFVLSTHYRRAPTYTPESMGAAERAMERFYTALQPAREDANREQESLGELVEESWDRFHDAMDDDFNTPQALAALFDLARAINAARDQGAGGRSFAQAQNALREMLQLLGFRLEPGAQHAQADTNAIPFIELLVEVRRKLRSAKQWAIADEVRDRMADLGVTLEDTPDGTVWKWE